MPLKMMLLCSPSWQVRQARVLRSNGSGDLPGDRDGDGDDCGAQSVMLGPKIINFDITYQYYLT
jgi:hypothetical protein